MQTRESVTVELGVDNTQLATGLARSEGILTTFTDKLSHKFEKKFNKLLYGGLVGLAVHTLHELLPTAEEFWDSIYGVDPENEKKFDAFRERFRKLRDEVDKLAESLQTAQMNAFFKTLDPEDQKRFLGDQIRINQAMTADAERRAKKELPALPSEEERQRHEWRVGWLKSAEKNIGLESKAHKDLVAAEKKAEEEYQKKFSDREAAALAAGEAQAENLKLQKEGVELAGKLAEVQKKIDDEHDRAVKANEETKERFHKRHLEQLAKEAEAANRSSEAQRRNLESFMPTLRELADSGYWTGRGTSGWGARRRFRRGPFAGMAQDIEALGEQAKDQFIWGDVEGAKGSIGERNRLYDQLADLGIVPQRAEKVAEAQIQMAENIRAIREDGVNIIPNE